LGLALAAMIAQSHDAELSVRNGDSGGAVFTLHLPISRIRLAQPVEETVTGEATACI